MSVAPGACRGWLCLAALSGAAAVGLGAFGAHGLEEGILKEALASAEATVKAAAEKRVEWFHTAFQYHALHALALGLLALAPVSHKMRCAAGLMFLAGTLMFSGTLYAMAMQDIRLHWSVVPAGGSLYILGWLTFAIAAVCCRPKSDAACCS